MEFLDIGCVLIESPDRLKGFGERCVRVVNMLKITAVILFIGTLTGCCGVLNELGSYTQPYLDNETLQNCVEGSTVDTYVAGNTTKTIEVKITKNFASYCQVEYTDGNTEYIAKYDKGTGEICSYESQKPGMSKSLSLCGEIW